MKKVFGIMAIATLMVACNNSADSTKTEDTPAAAPATTEAAAADTTQKAAADTTQAAAPADTTQK